MKSIHHINSTQPSGRANTWRQTVIYYTLHISISAGIAFLVTSSVWIALAVSMLVPAVQVLAWLSQHGTERQTRRAQHPIQNRHDFQSHVKKLPKTAERYLAHYAQVA